MGGTHFNTEWMGCSGDLMRQMGVNKPSLDYYSTDWAYQRIIIHNIVDLVAL